MRGVGTRVAACLAALAGLAMPAQTLAQSSPVEALIFDIWTEFGRTCIPFINSPQRAAQPEELTFIPDRYFQSDDGTVFLIDHGQADDYSRGASVQVHIGEKAAGVACEVFRNETQQPFGPEEVSSAFRRLVAQLDGVTMHGGDMRAVPVGPQSNRDLDDWDELFQIYFVEGALGKRNDFIEIEIAEEALAMYLYATVLREDWK